MADSEETAIDTPGQEAQPFFDPTADSFLKLLVPAAAFGGMGALTGGKRGFVRGLGTGLGITAGGVTGRMLTDHLINSGYLESIGLKPNTIATLRYASPFIGGAIGGLGGYGISSMLSR